MIAANEKAKMKKTTQQMSTDCASSPGLSR